MIFIFDFWEEKQPAQTTVLPPPTPSTSPVSTQIQAYKNDSIYLIINFFRSFVNFRKFFINCYIPNLKICMYTIFLNLFRCGRTFLHPTCSSIPYSLTQMCTSSRRSPALIGDVWNFLGENLILHDFPFSVCPASLLPTKISSASSFFFRLRT